MKTIAAPSPEPDDATLVARCRRGEAEAFRQLFRRYQGKVRGTLVRLGAGSRLDDATQEVFLKVWRGLAGLRDPAVLGTWIYRLTVHVAADLGAEGQRDAALEPLASHGEPAAPTADPGATLDARRAVARALAALDFPHRAVLVLSDLEGLTAPEVAEALAIPEGTVKSRLFHARKRAAEALRKEGHTP